MNDLTQSQQNRLDLIVNKIKEEIKTCPFVIKKEKADKIREEFEINEHLFLSILSNHVAVNYSIPPISKFHAGGASRGTHGNYYLGSNLEFCGLPLNESVHAEQFLVSNMVMNGELEISLISTSPMPCGHCRQFLRECKNSDELLVVVSNRNSSFGTQEFETRKLTTELLPFSFSGLDLGNTVALMENSDFNYSSVSDFIKVSSSSSLSPCQEQDNIDSDLLERMSKKGLGFLKRSYAPYSNCKSVVVIHCQDYENNDNNNNDNNNATEYDEYFHNDDIVSRNDDRIYCGVYLENAAFNPSLSPLQCCLSSVITNGEHYHNIHYVLLIEIQNGSISQQHQTHTLLSKICSKQSFHFFVQHLIE
eukprot:TRINITY_DN995_c6_g1_i1.p1 TRINITY_DN995_c6_g1~~TRINITY_DN995_c6_g1_i1.p1  ORF type:complete len:363 (-),score=93.07 TRINITY_DN995_c6_g1_i1:36-1124(-)